MALASPSHIPRNARFRLIQFYILHRAYLTPAKINRFFNRTDAACLRCSHVDAVMLHMMWACPALTQYWVSVFSHLSLCTGRKLPQTWETGLLGIQRRDKKHRATTRFIDLGLLLAKRLITKYWKANTAPLIPAWIKSITTWAQAKSAALHTEEIKGLRKYPMASFWDAVLTKLMTSQHLGTPITGDTEATQPVNTTQA